MSAISQHQRTLQFAFRRTLRHDLPCAVVRKNDTDEYQYVYWLEDVPVMVHLFSTNAPRLDLMEDPHNKADDTVRKIHVDVFQKDYTLVLGRGDILKLDEKLLVDN